VSPRFAAFSRCVFVLAGAAWARAASADDALATARERFAAAESDEDAGLWSDALVKLREVAAVRFTSGVRYHVALCEEHTGQLVEALADYTEADRQARSEGARDVLKLVGVRIAELKTRIPHIAIRVVPVAGGTVATVDGKACADAVCTQPVPVDPGPHRLEAHAPDRAPASAELTVHERETVPVDLLLLYPYPAEAAPPAPSPPARSAIAQAPPARSHTVSILAGIGSLALVGAGIAAFVAAGNDLTSGIRACGQLVTTAPGACDGEKSSVRALDWTAAAAWAGAVAAGTIAVVTWRGARADAAPAPSTSVVAGPGSVGVGGTF
jgi:hypothetical protein